MSAKLLALIVALAALSAILWSSHDEHPLSYRDYDKYKAVNTCMLKIYLEHYQQYPAEENQFFLCEQRYLALYNTLSVTDFIHYKLAPAHTQHPDQSTGNLYYDTLYGIPTPLQTIPISE